MKTKQEITNFINQKMRENYKEIDTIPYRDSTGYNKYGSCWAAVVSVDIRDFKEFSKKYKNEYVVKTVQVFTQLLAEVAKDNLFKEYFRDIYFVGDEVIVVFNGAKKSGISSAVNYAFYANSICNHLIHDALKNNRFNTEEFKVGIGIWTSNDNSLVLTGHKGSANDSLTTLIGSAINNASYIGKKANKYIGFNKLPAILMNNLTYINVVDRIKESVEKWTEPVLNELGEKIHGGNIVKSSYTND